MIIAPSLLSMNLIDMKKELNEIEQSMATWLHIDIMDGHFVPNLSYGPDFVKQIRKASPLFLDVHIMVSDPQFYAPVFIEAGADLITFHVEALVDVRSLIKTIKEKGCKVGLSIKPKSSLDLILPYINDIDLVLIMSVEPGFGGQGFMDSALDKIRELRAAVDRINNQVIIEVDGGINDKTGTQCMDAGADCLVAGSYIFKQDIKKAIHSLWKE